MGQIEQRLEQLGLTLPPVEKPTASYVKAVQTGDLLYTAGHGPVGADGKLAYRGKVGEALTVEQGYEAARLTGLSLLATIQSELGTLDRVVKIVKMLGMVYGVDDLGRQPEVINGCSDLLIEVFGPEIGEHARSAVGMGGLPGNMPVEIEVIVRFA